MSLNEPLVYSVTNAAAGTAAGSATSNAPHVSQKREPTALRCP
jgi:hypothetical protein